MPASLFAYIYVGGEGIENIQSNFAISCYQRENPSVQKG